MISINDVAALSRMRDRRVRPWPEAAFAIGALSKLADIVGRLGRRFDPRRPWPIRGGRLSAGWLRAHEVESLKHRNDY